MRRRGWGCRWSTPRGTWTIRCSCSYPAAAPSAYRALPSPRLVLALALAPLSPGLEDEKGEVFIYRRSEEKRRRRRFKEEGPGTKRVETRVAKDRSKANSVDFSLLFAFQVNNVINILINSLLIINPIWYFHTLFFFSFFLLSICNYTQLQIIIFFNLSFWSYLKDSDSISPPKYL